MIKSACQDNQFRNQLSFVLFITNPAIFSIIPMKVIPPAINCVRPEFGLFKARMIETSIKISPDA
jgi:hypothetical protein